MGNGRKKVWLCLLAVVAAAVMIGIIYSLTGSTEYSSQEGFLITYNVQNIMTGFLKEVQHVLR